MSCQFACCLRRPVGSYARTRGLALRRAAGQVRFVLPAPLGGVADGVRAWCEAAFLHRRVAQDGQADLPQTRAARQSCRVAFTPPAPLRCCLCMAGCVGCAPPRGTASEASKGSATGTRTRVARVRAEYPNQLDYSGVVFFVAGCCGRGWQVVAGVLWVGFARVRGRCAIATGVLWPLRGARQQITLVSRWCRVARALACSLSSVVRAMVL